MADINEIISKAGLGSVEKLNELLAKSNQEIQEAIVNSKVFTDTLAGAKTMGQLNKDVLAAAKANEQLLKLTAQRQLAEQRLSEAVSKAAAKRLSDEQKQIAADEKRIATLERKAAAQIKSDSANNGATISSGTVVNSSEQENALAAAQAAAIPSIQQNTKATDDNSAAKKRLAFEALQAKQAEKDNATALRNSVKEANAAKGSLEQRQLALARLQKTYTSLTVEERNSPFGQRLAKTIPQLNEQVLSLEKNIGRSQRNVGNYGSAFANAGQKAFSALRTIANILPGVGLAGLIGFAVEPIIDYVKELDVFKVKIGEIAAVGGAISSEYKKAVSDVTALGVSLNEFNKGTISRTEVIKRFNETIGQTVGELQTVEQVEDFYNKKSQDFVKATLLRAQAQAALNVATEKNSEALKRQLEGRTFSDYLKATGKAFVEAFTGQGVQSFGKILNDASTNQVLATAKLRKEGTDAVKEYERLQKAADEFAKTSGINFRGNETKNREKQGKDLEKIQRDNAAKEIQALIDSEKEKQKIYDKQLSNEEFSYEARIDARNKFYESSLKIAELEAQKERKLQELTQREIKEGKKVSDTERLAIEKDYAAKVDQINIDLANKTTAIFNSTNAILDAQRAAYSAKSINELQAQRDTELAVITSAFNQRGDLSVKAQEKFDAERLAVANKYAKEEIKLLFQQTQQEIDIRSARGEDVSKLESDLAALRLRYQELDFKEGDDKNKKRLDKEKELQDQLKQLYQETFDFAIALTNGAFEKNIQRLEKEKKAATEKKDRDIENVEESLLTEEQKAEQIAIINSQAEAKQKEIDARIAAQKRKQAIADKAAALAQIAINTAVATTKTLGQTGIFGLPLTSILIAFGALQAATVLAQPIPEFRHGGTMQHDGIAKFGEEGRELRLNPDGSTELTPASTTYGYVQKGTKFFTANDTKRILAKPEKLDYAGKSWDVSGIIASQEKTASRVEKAVSKIKSPSTIITKHGMHRQNIKAATLNNYYKKNLS